MFIDGNQEKRTSSNTSQRIFISNEAKVIAVKATKAEKPRIFLSSNFGVDSNDGQWKCSEIHETNWTALSFDESKWKTATITTEKKNIDGVVKTISWIVPESSTSDTLYCRRRIGKVLL